MGHRDSLYRLSGVIEIVGGKRAGFIVMQAVNSVCHDNVKKFVAKHLDIQQKVHTDGFSALSIIDKTQQHEARVTPSELVDEWLPWAHIAISNLKAFLLGTFYGVSGKYLQEYLSEFCYRFNRRQMEKEIPNRLLNLEIIHTAVHCH